MQMQCNATEHNFTRVVVFLNLARFRNRL